MKNQTPDTVTEIIDRIGWPRARAAMGVSDSQIRRHRLNNILPASWFDFCEKALKKKLPRELFSFKVDVTQEGDK